MASMSKESIGFTSKAYSREEADFVLDRSFAQFGQEDTTTSSGKTVEQFFVDYEDLFFEIPVEGEINSHQYLARKSAEIVNLNGSENALTDVQPLLDEITLLRSQSVLDQQTIIDLKTQLATIGQNPQDTERIAALRTELANELNGSN